MKKAEQNHQEILDTYFFLLNQLYENKEGAIEGLLDLWDDDGTFEFCGPPPLTGEFYGKNAIHVLYKARTRVKGMPLMLEGNGLEAVYEEAALGSVKRKVDRIKPIDKNRITAWTTATIGTADGRGFQCVGNYTCTFRDGKISKVRITVVPMADAAPDLRLDGLSVDDIGRLALAAWAVV